MKTLTTTVARKQLAEIVDNVRYRGAVYGLGRRNRIDAIIMRFPEHYHADLDEVTILNANSASFDFLKDEPELYTMNDLKKRYA